MKSGLKHSDVWNHFTKMNENSPSEKTANMKEHLKSRYPAYFQSTSTTSFENERFVEPNNDTSPTSISSNDHMMDINATAPLAKHPQH